MDQLQIDILYNLIDTHKFIGLSLIIKQVKKKEFEILGSLRNIRKDTLCCNYRVSI